MALNTQPIENGNALIRPSSVTPPARLPPPPQQPQGQIDPQVLPALLILMMMMGQGMGGGLPMGQGQAPAMNFSPPGRPM